MQPWLELITAVREVGVLGMLVLILVGGFRRWWVFGWNYDGMCARYETDMRDLRDERDQWKGLVISANVKERRAQELTTT